MKIIINESQVGLITEMIGKSETEVKGIIMRLHGLPKEYKEFAVDHVQYVTNAGKGKVSELTLPSDFERSLKERSLPNGFSMGVDKNGYFIHTHRARSKSYKDYNKISQKDIKFIDSTG